MGDEIGWGRVPAGDRSQFGVLVAWRIEQNHRLGVAAAHLFERLQSVTVEWWVVTRLRLEVYAIDPLEHFRAG